MKSVERTKCALTSFLYILMRDYLPTGTVEDIYEKHIQKVSRDTTLVTYDNEYLYGLAHDLKCRLKDSGICKGPKRYLVFQKEAYDYFRQGLDNMNASFNTLSDAKAYCESNAFYQKQRRSPERWFQILDTQNWVIYEQDGDVKEWVEQKYKDFFKAATEGEYL